MRRIAVLDAPSNLGLRPPTATSVPGCAKAPGALRDQGLLRRLNARDAGCLTPPRYDPGDWRPGDGVCHAPEIAGYSRRLADRIGAILDQGEFPVILGGDCSIVLGSALAMHRLGEAVGGRIGLVFVDGHSDFRHPGNASYVGAAAGEDLALVTGRGQHDLAAIEGRRPYYRDIDVVVMGIRAQDEYRLDLQAAGIVTRPVPALRVEGAARSAQWAKDQLVDCAGYWVHIDVDVLDPAVMPAVDAPEPGGIAFPELEILLAGLVESPHCLGVEITVFDPDYDPEGTYAQEITSAIVAGLKPAQLVDARPDLVAARREIAGPGRLGPGSLARGSLATGPGASDGPAAGLSTAGSVATGLAADTSGAAGAESEVSVVGGADGIAEGAGKTGITLTSPVGDDGRAELSDVASPDATAVTSSVETHEGVAPDAAAEASADLREDLSFDGQGNGSADDDPLPDAHNDRPVSISDDLRPDDEVAPDTTTDLAGAPNPGGDADLSAGVAQGRDADLAVGADLDGNSTLAGDTDLPGSADREADADLGEGTDSERDAGSAGSANLSGGANLSGDAVPGGGIDVERNSEPAGSADLEEDAVLEGRSDLYRDAELVGGADPSGSAGSVGDADLDGVIEFDRGAELAESAELPGSADLEEGTDLGGDTHFDAELAGSADPDGDAARARSTELDADRDLAGIADIEGDADVAAGTDLGENSDLDRDAISEESPDLGEDTVLGGDADLDGDAGPGEGVDLDQDAGLGSPASTVAARLHDPRRGLSVVAGLGHDPAAGLSRDQGSRSVSYLDLVAAQHADSDASRIRSADSGLGTDTTYGTRLGLGADAVRDQDADPEATTPGHDTAAPGLRLVPEAAPSDPEDATGDDEPAEFESPSAAEVQQPHLDESGPADADVTEAAADHAADVAGSDSQRDYSHPAGEETPETVRRPLGSAPLLDSKPLPATMPGMLRPRVVEDFSLPVQRPAFEVGPEQPADLG